MDNQHKQIKGYRDLTQAEIDLINRIKQHAIETEALLHDIETGLLDPASRANTEPYTVSTSPLRWLAEARTDLQKGLMCLTRSVAQQTTF